MGRVANRRRERLVITAVADAAANTTTIRLSHRALAPFAVDQQLDASRHKPPGCSRARAIYFVPGTPAGLCDVASNLAQIVPYPGWPLGGTAGMRSPFSMPIPLVWAGEHHRPDAAGARLRQVYVELNGMIGGSHKSERYMLFRNTTDKVRVGA